MSTDMPPGRYSDCPPTGSFERDLQTKGNGRVGERGSTDENSYTWANAPKHLILHFEHNSPHVHYVDYRQSGRNATEYRRTNEPMVTRFNICRIASIYIKNKS